MLPGQLTTRSMGNVVGTELEGCARERRKHNIGGERGRRDWEISCV